MKRLVQANPLNRSHRLADGLTSRWLALPHLSGGRQLYDIAGFNHGVLTNGPTWASFRRDGGFNSISFDGTDDYIDLGTTAALNLTGTMSFSCWYKSSSYTQNQAFIASSLNGGQANYAITFGFNDNKFELWNNATGPVISSTASISDPGWHHYVCTRSGTSGSWNLALYIDGLLDKSGTSALDPSGGSYPVVLGRFGGFGGYYLSGQLGDAALWSRALTAADVWELYQDSRENYRRTLNWRRSRAGIATGGGSPVTVTPGTATLTITRFAPTVRTPRTATPQTKSLTITSYAPTIRTPRTVVPGTASLTITKFAPTVRTSRTVVPSTRHITITTHAPTVLAPRTVRPGTAHLTITGHAPRVVIPTGAVVGAHAAAIEVSYARAEAIGISFSRATAIEVAYPRAEAIGIAGE